MKATNDFKFICKAKEDYTQLSHASNIITKYKSSLSTRQEKALELLIPEYSSYLKNMIDLKSYDRESIYKKVDYLNKYYNFMHSQELDKVFTSQGKFRPTVLEEFLFLLFLNYVADVKASDDKESVIDSGAVKAYTNLYFKAKDFKNYIQNPEIEINNKDQDYAIYRKFNITIDNKADVQIHIPAIAMEAKTYIDKTMLEGIIATAEKIKSGNPYTRFVAVTERYDVKLSVDPSYSRIDQIYVLRKAMRKQEWQDIDKDVVWKLFTDTKSHLERPWSDIEAKIKNDGLII